MVQGGELKKVQGGLSPPGHLLSAPMVIAQNAKPRIQLLAFFESAKPRISSKL